MSDHAQLTVMSPTTKRGVQVEPARTKPTLPSAQPIAPNVNPRSHQARCDSSAYQHHPDLASIHKALEPACQPMRGRVQLP